MARGIRKNSWLKTLLTQGTLGCFFRPLLYTTEEQIHDHFLSVFTDLSPLILAWPDLTERAVAYYWAIELPQHFFEEVFLPDEAGKRVSPILDGADRFAAEGAAYLTIAYTLAHLNQLLRLDAKFAAWQLPITKLIRTIDRLGQLTVPFIKLEQKFHFSNSDSVTTSEIQQIYLKNLIACLFTQKKQALPQPTNQEIQALEKFCFWKLTNAKLTTQVLLREQRAATGFLQKC